MRIVLDGPGTIALYGELVDIIRLRTIGIHRGVELAAYAEGDTAPPLRSDEACPPFGIPWKSRPTPR